MAHPVESWYSEANQVLLTYDKQNNVFAIEIFQNGKLLGSAAFLPHVFHTFLLAIEEMKKIHPEAFPQN